MDNLWLPTPFPQSLGQVYDLPTAAWKTLRSATSFPQFHSLFDFEKKGRINSKKKEPPVAFSIEATRVPVLYPFSLPDHLTDPHGFTTIPLDTSCLFEGVMRGRSSGRLPPFHPITSFNQ